MLEFLRDAAGVLVTVFVVSSMLNVGLTQRPSRILYHLRHWRFLASMVLTNLVVVPALMVFALELVPVADVYAAGLIVFSLAAGAPFLIKLTTTSKNDVALGATVLMVLMAATVVTMPILLPLLVEGAEVDSFAIVRSLLLQMIAPMIVGMLMAQYFRRFDALIQPTVARIGNISLYAVIVTILIGYSPELVNLELWIALAVGLVVLAIGFFVGYMMGDGYEKLKEMGGLGTAQRGTAAAMIVASQNFDDPRVLVVITILNILALVFLISAAKLMSRDNEFLPLEPVAADDPTTSYSRQPN